MSSIPPEAMRDFSGESRYLMGDGIPDGTAQHREKNLPLRNMGGMIIGVSNNAFSYRRLNHDVPRSLTNGHLTRILLFLCNKMTEC